MANKLYEEDNIQAIANAIRSKNGSSDTYMVSEMAQAVLDISTGLEYESGTWTPTEDIARGEIQFTRTHTDAPVFIFLTDISASINNITQNTNHQFTWFDMYKLWGASLPSSTTNTAYQIVYWYVWGTSASLSGFRTITQSDTLDTNQNYGRWWVTESLFRPYTNNTTRYWRAGRTYKWIAVWA